MIILASASPRRQELLQLVQIPFISVTSWIDESQYDHLPYELLPEELAYQKAASVAKKHPHDTIIGADTIVVLDGVVFGKPKDEEDARRMLQQLSGKTHQVLTGVCILHEQQTIRFTSISRVTFYPLTKDQIESYVKSQEPFDKAGAYAIQGLGSLLIQEIHGDYYTIVGLPIARIYQELLRLTHI